MGQVILTKDGRVLYGIETGKYTCNKLGKIVLKTVQQIESALRAKSDCTDSDMIEVAVPIMHSLLFNNLRAEGYSEVTDSFKDCKSTADILSLVEQDTHVTYVIDVKEAKCTTIYSTLFFPDKTELHTWFTEEHQKESLINLSNEMCDVQAAFTPSELELVLNSDGWVKVKDKALKIQKTVETLSMRLMQSTCPIRNAMLEELMLKLKSKQHATPSTDTDLAITNVQPVKRKREDEDEKKCAKDIAKKHKKNVFNADRVEAYHGNVLTEGPFRGEN